MAMNKSPEELYKERIKRVADAIELKTPDRVPFTPFCTFFAAKYAGISFQEAMYDFDKTEKAIEKLTLDLQPDMCPDTFRVLTWAATLDVLDYKQLKWPGHGVGPNTTYQFVEGEYMSADEYDDFILDPTGFLLSIMFPRIWGSLSPLKDLPSIPAAYYTRAVPFVASLGTTEMIGAIGSLLKASSEAQKVIKRGAAFAKRMADLGFPPQFGSSVYAPFDYIGDFMRGTKGIMLDMYRCPDKLLHALDKVYRLLIRPILKYPRLPGVHLVFIPLHKGLDGFMSQDQFKTFFWPTLKQIMLDLIEAGFTPCPLWEGRCDSRLEIIADMPEGKALYWFEQTNLIKAKEVLGNRICIRGNVPASLLNVGRPEQVKEYCRRLIEQVGKGGGFILDGATGIPDEARPENVKAMAEAVREYGVYH
jgi:uroporphyrinogen-III decarboxylase